ncbi:MAG: 16S rRNA (uracil(1498)-N(3))-methyltransferase [Planctomycetota bacterium]|nr:MAG: 16S rRNA (uracil(1498)-N(3))-methyltransferase [Planctomycetota bacterium]
MDRYHVPELARYGPGSRFALLGPEAHHLGRVKRARPGEVVLVFDGLGDEAWAQVEAVERGRVWLTRLARPSPRIEPGFELEIAMAVIERKRLLWAVEKCTELGVGRIVLLETERTDRGAGSVQRLHARALEAAKQSGVLRPAVIEPPRPLERYLSERAESAARKLLLDPRAPSPLGARLAGAAGCRPIAVAIGPPGGWTAAECERCVAAGFEPVRFGRSVLRTETAAIAVAGCVRAQAEVDAARKEA